MYVFSCDLILNQKEEWVKLYEDTIIICEAMDGEYVFRCVRDMEDIAKMKILSRLQSIE
jgi:hypothetical protein